MMYKNLKYAVMALCVLLLHTSVLKAQDPNADVTGINLAVVMPATIDGLDQTSVQLIGNKLTNILTNNGLASDDQDKTFILTPSFLVTGTSATAATLKKLIIVNCNFSLFIKQNSTKTVFASYSKVIQGTGFTKEEALQSAVTQAGTDEAGIAAFIQRGKQKIGAYYQANCAQFMSSADREIAQNHLDAARTILQGIPTEAGDCYTNAQTKMGEIFKRQYGSLDKAVAQLKADSIVNPASGSALKLLAAVKRLIGIRNDQDKTPPVIELITPKVTRGQTVEADVKNNTIYVSGNAKDPSGIATVTVNGHEVPNVTADGFFQANISGSENDLTIGATDKKGNNGSSTFHLGAKNAAPTGSDAIQPLASGETYHAIFIANADYSGSWPALPTTVPEARSLAKELEDQYNFSPANVDTLFNKNRKDMLVALSNKLKKMGPNDNLVIYYAGHGKFNSTENKAYWVPLDASDEVDYISNNMLTDLLNNCAAKHILVMADACFSGAMRGGFDAPPQFENSSRSRQILASGGTEPVPGVSVYVQMLLEKLKANDQKFMSARDLQAQIYPGIKNGGHTECTLQPLQVIGSEGGQFYFKKN